MGYLQCRERWWVGLPGTLGQAQGEDHASFLTACSRVQKEGWGAPGHGLIGHIEPYNGVAAVYNLTLPDEIDYPFHPQHWVHLPAGAYPT